MKVPHFTRYGHILNEGSSDEENSNENEERLSSSERVGRFGGDDKENDFPSFNRGINSGIPQQKLLNASDCNQGEITQYNTFNEQGERGRGWFYS